MKEGWEYSTIGDLCDKMNGLWKGKIGPFVNVGVIRNANFTKSFTLSFDNIEYLDVEAKQYKTRKLQKGDLIVEKSGGSEKQPVGRTVLFDKEDGEYSFSNFTSVLRIKDKSIITPEFLYKYILFVYLRGDTRKMQKATTGIHNIEFDKFLSIPVPIISLSEQQSIIDYLDSAFAKIDAMKVHAEKALNEAKALFQASLKEMLEPKEGWGEKTLKDVSVIYGNYGLSVPSTEFNGVRYLRITDITEWGDLNDEKVSAKLDEEKEQELLEEGDILFARTGATVGKTLMYKEAFGKCLFAGYLIRYRLNKEIVLPKFVFYITHSDNYYKWVLENQKAAAQPNISAKLYNEYILSYPSLSEQQSIVTSLDSLKSKVDRLQENFDKISQECEALKQAILRQVFE